MANRIELNGRKRSKSSDYFRWATKSYCNQYRKNELVNGLAEPKAGVGLDKLIGAKDIIKGFSQEQFTMDELNILVSEAIPDGEIAKQSELERERLQLLLQRYLMTEKNLKNIHWTTELDEKPVVHLEDEDILVLTDAYKWDETNKVIEFYSYRTSKPQLKARGRNRETKPADSELQLYVMAAMEWAENNLPRGEKVLCVGSFYHLRKDTDSSASLGSNDFFDGTGNNIVSLEVKYEVGKPNEEFLTHFFELKDEWELGVEACNGDACNGCKNKFKCNYIKTIKPEEKEEKTGNSKKSGKITPTNEQQKVIDKITGWAQVVAKAGTGKTFSMVRRILNMVQNGADLSKIYCVSFSEAAVTEIRDRIVATFVEEGIAVDGEEVKSSTFHGLIFPLVRKYWKELGLGKMPRPIDKVRKRVVIARLLNENNVVGISYMNFAANTPNLRGALACAEKEFEICAENPEYTLDSVTGELQEIEWYRHYSDNAIANLMNLYKEYHEEMFREGLIEFSEMETLMQELLKIHPEVLNELDVEHVIVDEAQDTSPFQMELVRMISELPTLQSGMVVGDDGQAIYGFRGCSSENFLNFRKFLGKPVEMLTLTETKRCTPQIVEFADALVDLNDDSMGVHTVSTREDGKKPTVSGVHSKKDEYAAICDGIEKNLAAGLTPEQIAVISFNRNSLTEIAAELSARGINWVMKNPMPLNENSRVQAALGLATAFFQPEAETTYYNYVVAKYDGELPAESIVAEEIEQLKAQFTSFELLEIGYQRQIFHTMLENICERGVDEIYDYFLTMLDDCEDLVEELEFCKNFNLYGDGVEKKMEQSYAGVTLVTAHSSKGLEWDCVYVSVSGFDSKRLHTGRRKLAEIAERRRLLYVACTRARNELHVTGQYVAYGPKDDQTYNQFLRDCYNVAGYEYDPIDHMAEAKKAEKKVSRSKNPTGGKSREMTPEEIVAYNKLVAGSEQMTVFDYKSISA